MSSLAICSYLHTFYPRQSQLSADFWTIRTYSVSYLGSTAILIAITSSWNLPHSYRYLIFLFQDYRQIVNTTFLKAKMQRILFFFEHEVLELQNSNNESLDGLAFFPTNSWPRGIQTFFHKSEIGGTNTFNFILFAFANNMSHHFLLNFLFIKYRQNPGKIHKRVFQTEWMINSIPAKETPMVLLR